MPLLEVNELRMIYPRGRLAGGREIVALNGVDLTLDRGSVLAVVGESGSGKSTLARCIVRILRPTAGRIVLDGIDITALAERQLRPIRPRMSMVFQNPSASLNPRKTITQIVAMPLAGTRLERRTKRTAVTEAIEKVGLEPSPDVLDRLPHGLSGGEKQRVALARALVTRPELLVLDEPMSALDVVARIELGELIRHLGRELNLACLLIAHDLTMVRHIADRVAVMHEGRLVEEATVESIFSEPSHQKTIDLVRAISHLPSPR